MFHLNELVLFQCHLVLDDRLARRYRWDAHRDVLTVEWRLGTVAVVESVAETETKKPKKVENSFKNAQGGGVQAKTGSGLYVNTVGIEFHMGIQWHV